MSRPRIGFLTSTNARNKRAWSGIHFYMAQALQEYVGDVTYFGPVDQQWRVRSGQAISLLSRSLFGMRYGYAHTHRRSIAYARAFKPLLAECQVDVLIAPAGSTEIAHLETDVPIIYFSDTTFANLLEYYRPFSSLWPSSVREGNEIEQLAILRAAACSYPSEWAAASAVKDYGASPARVHVIPFGANIDRAPDRARVVSRRLERPWRLLLVGIDWHRKGADRALEATIELVRRGRDVRLTVCGCEAPRGVKHPALTVVPPIDKNDTTQYSRFEELMWEADAMVMPTRAECFGLVFCEASAYGMPVFATDTGGVRGAVIAGQNGQLLAPNAHAGEWADRIEALLGDERAYHAMVSSSNAVFNDRLNWRSWAQAVSDLIRSPTLSR